jgi:cell wall assembly regulator SMI1
MRAAWVDVEAVVDDDVRRALRPGASAARLAALVKSVGKLPPALRSLLARHDGMRAVPLFLNVRLLGASEIVKTWRMRAALREDAPYDWHSDWLPMTEADGDYLCVDRKSGRVLELRTTGRKARVVAPSLAAWFGRVPRLILGERRSDAKRAGLLPKPSTELPKRVRERLAKLDDEQEYFVRYAADLQTIWQKRPEWKGAAPAFCVLDYHPVARLRAADVVARALELGYIERIGDAFRTTAKGRRVRDA